MTNQKWRKLIVSLSCIVMLLAVGCGDDAETDSNNSSNNNVQAENNNTPDPSENNSSTNNSTTNNSTPDPSENNSTEDPSENNSTTNNSTPGECEPLNPPVGDGACDALCQTGCSENEACMTAANQTGQVENACVPAGPGGQGDECNQNSLCQAGFGCFSEDGVTSLCLQYCRPDSSDAGQCPGDSVCAPMIENEFRIGICVESEDSCSDFPDTCPEGENCYMSNLGMQCFPYNADAQAGNACAAPNECNNNQRCLAVEGAGACYDICETNEDCGEGGTCNPIGDENGQPLPYGACL